jgi:TPP-dependent pyruvate/acetoin dehydrogenase alpha subunit
MTKEQLEAFEADIAAEFNAGHIKAPIHLAGGNEDQLISIFRGIGPQDWCLTQWRSHFVCLLKGVPPVELKAAIMAGHSITLNFPEHRILSSAIAGGHLPIALGIAWQIKREGRDEKVFAFCGDMTARMGIYHECLQYATGFDLPIRFIREMNHLSVCTDTREAWGRVAWDTEDYERGYSYKLGWPHSGAGQRVNF